MSKTIKELATYLKSLKIDIEYDKKDENVFISGVSCNSLNAHKDDIFICKGTNFKDEYLDSAVSLNISCYLSEVKRRDDIPCIICNNIRQTMVYVSKFIYDFPDESLDIIGITGTKGKTTTATFLREIIIKTKKVRCGLLGTHMGHNGVSYIYPDNTTPEAPELYAYLKQMVDNKCQYCVMEISSQALKYDRVLDLNIDIGALLNIGCDHISPLEHPSLQDYIQSKEKLLKICKRPIDFRNTVLDKKYELKMIGDHNQFDAYAAKSIAKMLGIDESRAINAIKDVQVKGRMEIYPSLDNKLVGIVDYAHNKESFLSFFKTIKKQYPNAYIISCFGVVGGRALSRYYDLPHIGSLNSDYVILTTGESHYTDPLKLLKEIEKNLIEGCKHEVIVDRNQAVRRSYELAIDLLKADEASQVIVCCLEKGHESTIHLPDKIINIIPDDDLSESIINEYNKKLSNC